MADLIDLLRSRYNVDIKEINLIKLYKIESPDLSDEKLEFLLADRRKKWEKSINGPNEKFARRDKAYLDKADVYERILRDSKLRHALFEFYNGKQAQSNGEVTQLAKDYFELVATTTNIDKEIASFFFEYFPSEKKNKKSIVDYLKKEYKLIGYFDKTDEKETSKDEIRPEQEDERKNSFMVCNLFQKKTILMIRKCESHYEACLESKPITDRYPKLRNSMYDFLGLEKIDDYDQFRLHVEELRAEAANVRYDRGTEFVPLVDFANGIAAVITYSDIRDNFDEFKLLLKYPKLTPYMFSLVEMKKKSLDLLYKIASNEYGFRNMNDFLLSYFNIIHDNFGIYNQAVKHIMNEAEKSAGKQKILNKIDKVFGIKKTKKMEAKVRVIHILTYWPVYLLSWIFNIVKFIFDNIGIISIVIFAIITLGLFIFGGYLYGPHHLFYKGFNWIDYIDKLTGLEKHNWFNILFESVEAAIVLIIMYIAPGGVISLFLFSSVIGLYKKFDIVGIERTFKKILDGARKRTEEKYEDYKDRFVKKRMPGILVNFGLLVLIIFVIVIIAI